MTSTTYVTLLRISSKIIETCVITAADRGGPRRMSCDCNVICCLCFVVFGFHVRIFRGSIFLFPCGCLVNDADAIWT